MEMFINGERFNQHKFTDYMEYYHDEDHRQMTIQVATGIAVIVITGLLGWWLFSVPALQPGVDPCEQYKDYPQHDIPARCVYYFSTRSGI